MINKTLNRDWAAREKTYHKSKLIWGDMFGAVHILYLKYILKF